MRLACSLLDDAEIEVLDLNVYELKVFSVDKEEELGQPQFAQDFVAKIGACNALIISFAVHNRSFTTHMKSF